MPRRVYRSEDTGILLRMSNDALPDLSGNGHIITNSGSTTVPVANQPFTRMRHFDKSGTQYIQTPDHVSLQVPAITIAFFFSIPTVPPVGVQNYLHRYVGGGGGGYVIYHNIGLLRVALTATAATGPDYDINLFTPNQIYHFAVTYEDGSDAIMYIDGDEVSRNSSLSGPITYTSASPLTIGANSGPASPSDMDMADLIIDGHAWKPWDIKNIAAAHTSRDPQAGFPVTVNTIANWSFDADTPGADDGVVDGSGNGHHGTTGDGVVAHYKFNDDAADQVIADVTGNYNAVLQGFRTTADLSAPGKINDTLIFNGSDEWGRVSSSPINGTQYKAGFSIEGWFRSDDVTTQSILAELGDGNWSVGRLYIQSGVLRFWNRDHDPGGESFFILGTTPLSIDTWFHVAITYNGAGSWKLYLDLNVEGTDSSNISGTYNHSELGLGGRATSGSNSLGGGLDSLRFFHRELSLEELTYYHNGGAGTENRFAQYQDDTVGTSLVGTSQSRDFVTVVPNHVDFDLESDRTIRVKFRATGLGLLRFLVCKRLNVSAEFYWDVYVNSDDSIRARLSFPPGTLYTAATSPGSLLSGRDYTVHVTLDSVNYLWTLYVDGSVVEQKDFTSEMTPTPVSMSNTRDVGIGGVPNIYDYSHVGEFLAVDVLNYVMTPKQILDDAKGANILEVNT